MEDTSVPKDVVFFHGAFVHYITPDESTAQPQDQSRHSASLKKLAGFSETHLIELSADMYDELQRRLSPERRSAGPLEPRKHIHWKRNDARRHVGSLPENRFRDICRDLVTEQERRYHELNTGPTYPLQDSMPMSTLRARRSQKSLVTRNSSYTMSIASKNASPADSAKKPLHVSTDQVLIQSVNESNITPTKARIIESESDSEYDSDEDDSSSTHFKRRDSDPNDTNDTDVDYVPLSVINKTEEEEHQKIVRQSMLGLPADKKSSDSGFSSDTDEEPVRGPSMSSTKSSASESLHRREFDTEKLRMSNKSTSSDSSGKNYVSAAGTPSPVKRDMQPNSLYADASEFFDKELNSSSSDDTNETGDSTPTRRGLSGSTAYPMSPPQSSPSSKAIAPSQLLSGESNYQAADAAGTAASATGGDTTHLITPNDSRDLSLDEYQQPSQLSGPSQAEIEALKESLDEQRLASEQAKRDVAKYLEEMRALTRQHEEQTSRADSLDSELSIWRHRNAKLSKELESARQSRLDVAIKQEEIDVPLPAIFASATGKVKESQVRLFMKSISVLTAAIHNKERSQTILDSLHRVVTNTRDITSEDQLVVRTVKKLISVVRNYTVSSGFFPRVLVNSACSDLTVSTIEYIKAVKVIPEIDNLEERKSPLVSQTAQSAPKAVEPTTAAGLESDRPDSGASIDDLEPLIPSTNSIRKEVRIVPSEESSPEPQLPLASQESSTEPSIEREIQPEPLIRSKSKLRPQVKQQVQFKTPESTPEIDETLTPNTSSENIDTPPTDDARRTKECSSSTSYSDSASAKAIHVHKESDPSEPSTAGTNESQWRPRQGPSLPMDESIHDLQTYLEEQTSGTVEAIGALLSGIKSNSPAGELKPLMSQINLLVNDMIEASNKTMAETRSLVFKNKGSFIVQNLKHCLDRMDMLRKEELDAIRDDAKPNRHLKQRLAGVNFDMAKSTKELVKTVEEVVLQDEVNHIDGMLS